MKKFILVVILLLFTSSSYANELCNPGFEYVYDVTAGCQTGTGAGADAEEWTETSAVRSEHATNGNNCRTGSWCLNVTGSGSDVDVTWTSLTNTTATPTSNDLKKTAGGAAFNADAVSNETISNVTGAGVKFYCDQTTLRGMVGLADTDPDANYTSIDAAIYCLNTGTLRVYERGTLVYSGGMTYTATDEISIILNSSGYFEYKKAGTTFYTSTMTGIPSTMFVDTSLYDTNMQISNVRLVTPVTANAVSGSKTITTGITWTSKVNTDTLPDYNDLKKVGGNGASWDAGAISAEKIYSSDTFKGIKFKCAQNNGAVAMGLSHDNPDATFNSIEYSIYCRSDGYIHIYENGTVKYGSTGFPYTSSDELSITVNGSGYPEYRINNTLIYTSVVLPTYPLFIDASMYSSNNIIDDVHQSSLYIRASGYVKGTSGTATITVTDVSGNNMGNCQSSPLTVTSTYQLITVNCVASSDVVTVSIVGGDYWDDIVLESVYGKSTPYNLLPPITLTLASGYTQDFTQFTKEYSMLTPVTLTTNSNITGVRFTIDGGSYIDDTNTSDLNYSVTFSGVSPGGHTVRATTMEGGAPTEVYIENQFYVVDQIWGLYGDSITSGVYSTGSASAPLSNISKLSQSQAIISGGAEGTGGRQSSTGLVFESQDPYFADNTHNFPGYGVVFASAMKDDGKYIFVLNEGKGSDDTGYLLTRWSSDNLNGRCVSVDGNSGNASKYGVTHALIMFGVNDYARAMAPATFESNLNSIVQNILNCGVPAYNIYLAKPTYASDGTHDALTFLDEVDNVVSNKNIKAGPNFYDFIKDFPSLLGSDGLHPEWYGYERMGRLAAQHVLSKDSWGNGWESNLFDSWYGTEDFGYGGNIYLDTGSTYESPVYDFFVAKDVKITLSETMQSGTISKSVRCQLAKFSQGDVTPLWDAYSTPVSYSNVRYCQFKVYK